MGNNFSFNRYLIIFVLFGVILTSFDYLIAISPFFSQLKVEAENLDFDEDGIYDQLDNCPYISNPDQEDGNSYGVGDACYRASVGNCGGTTECFCGDTVTSDYTMVANLRGHNGESVCSSTGLTLNNGETVLTLDCQNYEIAGSGSDNGIKMLGSNDLVENCKIYSFDVGIYATSHSVVDNSEIYNNSTFGVRSVGGSNVTVSNNNIYSNNLGVGFDETIGVKVYSNHIYDNGVGGLAVSGRAMWGNTTMTDTIDENNEIYDNIIENNEGSGIIISTNTSRYENNIIRNNVTGLWMRWGRSRYIDDSGDTVGYGTDRSNDNLFSGNYIYGNTNDFYFIFAASTILDDPTNFSQSFVDNYVDGDDTSGKGVLYEYDVTDEIFSGLDIDTFVCMNCQRIELKDSTVRQIYLAYTTDSTISNIISDGAYNVINLTESPDNHFDNIQTQNIKNDFLSVDDNSTNITFTGMSDGDSDGVVDILDNCPSIANSEQRDDDENDVGNICEPNYIGCLADVNRSGTINTADRLLMQANLNKINCNAIVVEASGGLKRGPWCNWQDVNRDGTVNSDDVDLLLSILAVRPFQTCSIADTPPLYNSCGVANGVGRQTWNWDISDWSDCSTMSCDSGYIQSGDICSANIPLSRSGDFARPLKTTSFVKTIASDQIIPVLAPNKQGNLVSVQAIFKNNLRVGQEGQDVQNLQRFLNSNGFTVASSGFGSLGNESVYFLSKTSRALIDFQQKYLQQIGIVIPTGYLDEKTREFINSFYETQHTENLNNIPANFKFTKIFSTGQTSLDVKNLQIFLNSDSDTRLQGAGPGSPGKETSFFGKLTKDAVIRFQEKYALDILSSYGLTRGTGVVGPATIEKINSLLSN